MKGQLTRDQNGDLWMYIAPHHTGYWKFVDADDNWVDRGMALQVTGDAAALFAAAPELLEACQAVAADLEQLLDGDDFSGMSDEELFAGFLRVLRPAIAKAEGRSE
jgi:hypothetical protein